MYLDILFTVAASNDEYDGWHEWNESMNPRASESCTTLPVYVKKDTKLSNVCTVT